MFSKAPRFNSPKEKRKTPPCRKHTRTQSSSQGSHPPSTSTSSSELSPKSAPRYGPPFHLHEEITRALERIVEMETRFQNRLDVMEVLCLREVQPNDDGETSLESDQSTRTFVVEDGDVQEDATSCEERSGREDSVDFVNNCSEAIAEMVVSKLEERSRGMSDEGKARRLWNRVIKCWRRIFSCRRSTKMN
ncbi:hypothetical protein GEV33_000563 [Tenebrio molitor]|jgi:hypothetical protein|uniref:Uncharacterized protein n=1 Tax=Tenebrio molitor TaxID=7067 RepID=A0A8J6HWX0_TENMO|nr:hypothetical protein GEV33_000563 [Tenebrio molitor]